MKDMEFEYENPNELDEILYKMNSEDFIETELEKQLGEEIFSDYKTDYLDSYMTKYKFYKNEYNANDGFTESLKQNKDQLIEYVIDEIAEKFGIIVDEDCKNTRMAKTLYNFYVIDYKENLKNLFLNYINNNKKAILNVIKKEKRRKDISAIASKIIFANGNDALIIGNVSYIINEIIIGTDIEDFMDMIIDADDNVTNLKIKDYLLKSKISLTEDSFNAFLEPYIDEESGWSDIISIITIELNEKAVKSDVDIYE